MARPVPEEEVFVPSARREHREAMIDLKDLANRLAELTPKSRRALPLDDEAQLALDQLAGAYGRTDRRRLVMRVKLLLGRCDLEKLHAALAGDTPAAARTREAVRWRTRLVAGGDELLHEFINQHPTVDRQALRASLREARAATPAADGAVAAAPTGAALRAQARVLEILREAIQDREGADEVDEAGEPEEGGPGEDGHR